MAEILNLQVKDDSLKDVLSNNPYYIDVKGSVNICLIRCGQDIDACNSVTFSTMTNYGKILVLNPDKKKIGSCAIKLAYDTSNDKIDNNGNAKYSFVKTFITVPSLHRLNGLIYDMETFNVFSSVQKNGNILYVVLCTLSNGVTSVPASDPKLLNFRLMTELFTGKNVIPDIYGTKEITGSPNPVDIGNFIPPIGMRSFYDYTHPLNTKVNFRIFQTPMSVDSSVLTNLKTKLTPNITYENFKSAILKTINPFEGLFFYFSEDLTNRYKSFETNNVTAPVVKDKFKNISKEILEEQEKHEESEAKSFKKIDEKVFDEEENDKIANSEQFKSPPPDPAKDEPTKNITIIYTAIICLFFYNIIHTFILNYMFQTSRKLGPEGLSESIVELSNIDVRTILGAKFKMYLFLFIQGVLTFLCFFFSMVYMSTELSVTIHNYLYKAIAAIITLIFLLGLIIFWFQNQYILGRIKKMADNSFSSKEHYLFGLIGSKLFFSDKSTTTDKIKDISNNIKNTFISEDYSFVNNVQAIQSGGNNKHYGVDTYKVNEGSVSAVPAPLYDNMQQIIDKFESDISNKGTMESIFKDPELKKIISNNFANNGWKKDFIIYIFFIFLSFILFVYLYQYDILGNKVQNNRLFIPTNKFKGLNTMTNFSIISFTYFGLILLIYVLGSYCNIGGIQYLVGLLGIFAFLTGLTPCYPPDKNAIIPFWFFMAIIFVGFIWALYQFIQEYRQKSSSSTTPTGTASAPAQLAQQQQQPAVQPAVQPAQQSAPVRSLHGGSLNVETENVEEEYEEDDEGKIGENNEENEDNDTVPREQSTHSSAINNQKIKELITKIKKILEQNNNSITENYILGLLNSFIKKSKNKNINYITLQEKLQEIENQLTFLKSVNNSVNSSENNLSEIIDLKNQIQNRDQLIEYLKSISNNSEITTQITSFATKFGETNQKIKTFLECINSLIELMQKIQSKKGSISASMENKINKYINDLSASAPKEIIKNELKKMFKQNKLMEAYNQILPIFEQIITKLSPTNPSS